jgi:2-keto-4-pentenoate hydratase/2-oxohepta-3-ene-1,7-dioic acid hydratase in catechol pathway
MSNRATRREVLGGLLPAGVLSAQTRSTVTKYVRFRRGSDAAYGILDGDTIREIEGNLFDARKETGARHKLSAVKLLYPCEPPKMLAVGLNYRSHLGNRPAPSRPEIFYKPVSALQNPEDPIVIPKGAKNVHFEGEIVIVVGKRASRVSASEAKDHIFGVTCGNDVSERDWQNGSDKDLQWWRAKGADTFAPLGPAIAAGIDYGKLLLQTRVNGEVKQKQYTSDLLFDCPAIVSWISQAVTLEPGDVIYTGTPGTTSRLNPGDVVEIDIEGIGVLRNKVAAA